MLRGNLAADLVLNRRSRSAATRRFSSEPIRIASLPLADLGCESGICQVLLDRDQRETDFAWTRESSWSILFASAAIAPAQRRVETGCAAARPVFCYHGAVFWGED